MAAEMKVGDITQVESNIHAGAKYMHHVMDTNFKDEPMDALNKGCLLYTSDAADE